MGSMEQQKESEREEVSEMSNPFENDEASYVVLKNAEDQHSLWPSHIEVPDGWTVVHESDTRQACLEYVEREWTDLRPRSLKEKMAQTGS